MACVAFRANLVNALQQLPQISFLQGLRRDDFCPSEERRLGAVVWSFFAASIEKKKTKRQKKLK